MTSNASPNASIMTDAVFKNFRKKVGTAVPKSSTTPLLPADGTTPGPTPVQENSKIDNTKYENEGAEISDTSGKENEVAKDTVSSIVKSTSQSSFIRKPEPQKRRSISTDKPTVYIEVETTAMPWKLKPKDRSRQESVGNTSLSTILNSDEFDKFSEDNDNGSNIADWCHLGPVKEAVSVLLSAFYGIFVMVLGIVVPVAETFAGKRNPDVFELYYIYLYGISFLFLIFVFRDRLLCRHKTGSCRRRISRLCSRGTQGSYPVSESLQEYFNDKSTTSKKKTPRTGSFYLRIGAMAFGIGSMVHSGLNFGQYFQVFDGNKLCHHIALAIKPFLHLVFTFSQLYFIFVYSKVNIAKNKTISRFGLIHMCGTNVCVWFRVIVIQTISIIHRFQLQDSFVTSVTSPVTTTTNLPKETENVSRLTGRKLNMFDNETGSRNSKLFLPEVSCYWYSVMDHVLQNANPYLYPCTIQYSLVCGGILYAMWKSVSVVSEKKNRKMSSTIIRPETKQEDTENEPVQIKTGIDCTKTSRGLFLGIIISVGAIITMIAFHVLSNRGTMNSKAIILVHLSETAMYLIMTLAVILAAERMKSLGFKKNRRFGLESALLMISFIGLLLFAVFSVLSALFETDKPHGVLTILTNLFMIVQASLQTIFLLAGEQMMVKNKEQEKKKNGRELVIFLLMCNFSMWAMNTFETQEPEHNPLQLKFYNIFAWSVITFITVPLGLFYRFLSALWLANMWKSTWKLKLT